MQERYRADQGKNDTQCTMHESSAATGRKQFTFYRSYYEALSKLPEAQRLKALEAVIGYALDRKEPEGLDDMQEMAFMLIRPTLDAGRKMAAGGAKSKPKENLWNYCKTSIAPIRRPLGWRTSAVRP